MCLWLFVSVLFFLIFFLNIIYIAGDDLFTAKYDKNSLDLPFKTIPQTPQTSHIPTAGSVNNSVVLADVTLVFGDGKWQTWLMSL